MSLEKRYCEWLLEGLGAQFNFAQLVQAESVPAGLSGVKVTVLNMSKYVTNINMDIFRFRIFFSTYNFSRHFYCFFCIFYT